VPSVDNSDLFRNIYEYICPHAISVVILSELHGQETFEDLASVFAYYFLMKGHTSVDLKWWI
jgi:hypothetical protein